MSTLRIKQLTSTLGFVLLTAAVATVAASLFLPAQTFPVRSTAEQARTPLPPAAYEDRHEASPTLEDFARVWDKSLYRRLSDVAHEEAEQEVVAASSLDINLLGTFVEPGHTVALLSGSSGALEIKSEGQAFASFENKYEIVTILPRRVVVRHAGRLVTLTLDGDEG